jgi:hypothetical protein
VRDRAGGRDHERDAAELGLALQGHAVERVGDVAATDGLDLHLLHGHALAHQGRHNAALICLARRRIDVLHAMLRTQTQYQHKRRTNPASLLDKTHRTPPEDDAEGPDLHLLHSTTSSKVTYTTTSPSALVAHLRTN